MKPYWRGAIISFVATLLTFLGKSDSTFGYLKSHRVLFQPDSDTNGWQLALFISGLVISGFYLPVELGRAKANADAKEAKLNELLSYFKEVSFETIKDVLSRQDLRLRARFFVPTKG